MLSKGKQEEITSDLNNFENQPNFFTFLVKESQDTTGLNCLKESPGRVVVVENAIRHMMNEEN